MWLSQGKNTGLFKSAVYGAFLFPRATSEGDASVRLFGDCSESQCSGVCSGVIGLNWSRAYPLFVPKIRVRHLCKYTEEYGKWMYIRETKLKLNGK